MNEKKDPLIFKDISSKAFLHPTDKATKGIIEKIPGSETFLKQILGGLGDNRMRLLFLAGAIKIGPNQLPEIYNSFLKVAKILDFAENDLPEVFIGHNASPNAMAIGIDRPLINLNSGLIDLLSPKELEVVFAHELCHIMAGHALYKTLLLGLLESAKWLMAPISLPLVLALLEWERKAELSADRGTLLVTGNTEIIYEVLMKISHGSEKYKFNLDEFKNQAIEYQSSPKITHQIYKIFNLLWMRHPFPVSRIYELEKWSKDPKYQDILRGHYPKRQNDHEKNTENHEHHEHEDEQNLKTELLNAIYSYSDDLLKNSKVVSDLVKDVKVAGESFLGGVLKKRKKD